MVPNHQPDARSERRGRAVGRRAGSDAGRRTTRRAAAGDERAGLYKEVTARIVAELEAGRVPSVQPWDLAAGSGGAAVGLPRNAVTGRAYSGINILILWGAVIEHGYSSQGWLTFRQAIEAGGAVRKGERGVGVVFAHRFVPRDRDAGRSAGSGSDAAGPTERDDARAVPFLKRFTVFNVAQCEGLRAGLWPDPLPLPKREVVPVAERLIAASGVTFRIGGNQAFYAPREDIVQVPSQPAFFDQINYYRTALHELTHATGHASRLDRMLANGFGSRDYAREELIAEIGSAFLCASLGIVPTVRHADYIASWLDVLHGDAHAIFRAASAATRAADWLLSRDGARRADDTAFGGSEAA